MSHLHLQHGTVQSSSHWWQSHTLASDMSTQICFIAWSSFISGFCQIGETSSKVERGREQGWQQQELMLSVYGIPQHREQHQWH